MFDINNNFPSKVSIIGAARSGLAAALFFVERGSKVFVSDSCTEQKLMASLETRGLSGLAHESGGHTDRVLDCELLILSPGVPSDLPIIKQAQSAGIPVWSEMELGFQVSKATFLAVTGSAGKSTTASLAAEALKAAGIESAVAGNIGIPVISIAPSISADGYVVAEVSSFQLENIDRFSPKAAVVLNFMKNHLDRYISEDDYYNAKKQIARNFNKDNYLILNAKDPKLIAWSKEMIQKTNIIFFGENISGYDSFWCEQDMLRYRFGDTAGIILNFGEMFIKGRHNHENACAASALAKVAGVDDNSIKKGICSFRGLPHRLEFIQSIEGVSWYNDSKSTTAESVAVAVSAFPKGVHLIAGGKDKGCDFASVKDTIAASVIDIILIGEAADRIEEQWKGLAPIYRCKTLKDAVDTAILKSKPGEYVVFSPGCSSFDMFSSYEERGAIFRQLVIELGNERAGL
jgi:UDP-N-acetylmuramoylalanine--D-glutamate ligase